MTVQQPMIRCSDTHQNLDHSSRRYLCQDAASIKTASSGQSTASQHLSLQLTARQIREPAIMQTDSRRTEKQVYHHDRSSYACTPEGEPRQLGRHLWCPCRRPLEHRLSCIANGHDYTWKSLRLHYQYSLLLHLGLQSLRQQLVPEVGH